MQHSREFKELCCANALKPVSDRLARKVGRDATHVLDGLLDHGTDLSIQEHYTDTAGFTDHVFALCHLLGFRFAPRIQGLHDRRLYTMSTTEYSALGPLISGKIQSKRIEKNWNNLQRLGASIQHGSASASLLVNKLGAYSRQNELAWALREMGRLERTLFTLEWLQSPELRRRVTVGLNKGEARNALARAVFFHRLGAVSDRVRTYRRDTEKKLGAWLLPIALQGMDPGF